jgi:hypothetical protein
VYRRTVALLLAALAGGSALARGAGDPIEYLDENTGATISAVARPLVFAIERSDVAANLRDYVTLAAAAVNRSGRIQYVLVAYRWSTLDARALDSVAAADAALVLAADDRRIRLVAEGHTPHELGVDRLIHPPPNVAATPIVVLTDFGTLRFIAAARRLSIMTDTDPAAPRYELWDDQRSSLAGFVRYMDGPR